MLFIFNIMNTFLFALLPPSQPAKHTEREGVGTKSFRTRRGQDTQKSMAWNVTICSSASSLLKLSNKNRVDQVLGMASPQVSPTIRDHYNGEGPGSGGVSPKRQYYSAFDQQDEVVEDEIIMAGMECLGGQNEKKRRLTMEQVRFLESSFEKENKLEPERKAQLAKQLGLQPRQVAVWFQNRRARSKSKQLERDYNALKADYNAALKENEKLHAEVVRLNAQLKEGGGHAQEKKKTSTTNISSSNCASVGVKIELEVLTSAPHVNGLGDGDELSSPTVTDNEKSTSVLPLPAAAAAVIAAAKVAESANEAAAILSSTAEDLQILTNCVQQAHHMTAAANLAQQLAVKLEAEDYNLFYAQWPDSYDNNLFIAHWDDPFSY